MAYRLPTPCRHHGCPELTLEPYCAKHKGEAHRWQDEQRGSSTERGYDGKWRKARRRWLAEHPLCAECDRHGRVTAANTVDHIIPHRGDRKLFWRRSNWQSLCAACHNRKTAREMRGDMDTKIVLVCGPPGSGKIQWVSEHAERGDVVMDFDALVAALSGLPIHDKPESVLPFAYEARDAVIRRLSRPHSAPTVWIVATGATRAERGRWPATETVMLETPAEVCKTRLQGRPSGLDWGALVDEWWREYEREDGTE